MMVKSALPWFRMYADFLNDPKMISLAFEDQRHFIAVLALKAGGVLDQECAPNVLDRIVAQRTWIDYAIIGDVKRRLVGAGLIDEKWQPAAWEKRQMRSDSSAERVRAHREKLKQDANDTGNGSVTLRKRSSNALDKSREDKNRKEKNKTTRPRKRGASVSSTIQNAEAKPLTARALVNEGVDAAHARDWLTIRKAKRLPLTPTAWDETKEQAELAAMTPAAAVECAVKEGWAGFKAKWVTAHSASGSAGASDSGDVRWFETPEGIDAAGKKHGVRERKPDEDWRSYRVLVVKASNDRKAAEFVLADAQRFNAVDLYRFARATFGDALMPVDDYAS